MNRPNAPRGVVKLNTFRSKAEKQVDKLYMPKPVQPAKASTIETYRGLGNRFNKEEQ